MFILIIIVFFVGLGLYYVTSIDFEMGDGFTEGNKDIRDVDYKVVDKKDSHLQKAKLKEMRRTCSINCK
jgi:hypothetical protein